MPCTTCDTYYDTSSAYISGRAAQGSFDTPIHWPNPGADPAPARPRYPREPGVWCETCNCVVRVLICECFRNELLNGRTGLPHASWQERVGNRGVCSRGGHEIRVPTHQEITAFTAVKLKALQKWRRDLKNELLPELLRAHDANRTEIAKKILLYVGFDHPWKIY